ncbi:MAG: hypothetical protein CMH64_01110 [Nanoarchaeota archaeon]|nr:hypothetical protein [Nanoarchaeota archaeon]|tara:strand:+ start:342 stop:1217 length:876 start_codon:yes stop_codon:yes gene_type:complete
MKLIDLDECVINALNLFTEETLPKLNIKFKRPLVVGSGNAAVTGKMILEDKNAIFADEGNYKHKLKKVKVDGAILISASGTKHAPIIAKELKKRRIKTILLTNNQNAPASKFVKETLIFPKNSEPYTYNTSTYMSILLAKTKESSKHILKQIKKIKYPKNLRKYDAFYMFVPEKFDLVREMFMTKFDELFGSKISGRVFTVEQTKHAKTVVPSKKEFFIGIGCDDRYKLFGRHKMCIPLSSKANYAEVLAIGYYIIGQIQKQHPQYFKNNIENYTKEASKLFKTKIEPIVK